MGVETSQPYSYKAIKPDLIESYDIKDNSLNIGINYSINPTKLSAHWSILYPIGNHPDPRESHFSAYDEKSQKLFIGYGITKNGKLLNDCWMIDVKTLQWKQLLLRGDYVSPRYGANAAYDGNRYVYVFGGFGNGSSKYLSDFHRIDVETGDVEFIQSDFHLTPRISPFMGIYKNKLCIWGGFDGVSATNLNELNICDLNTMKWRKVQTNCVGHCRASYTVCQNYIIAYGAMQGKGLVFIDMEKEKTLYLSCEIDTYAPPFDLFKPGLIVVDKFIYLIGGRSQSPYSHVYGFDTTKRQWSIISIKPDNLTVSPSLSAVDDEGNYLLPSADSFSICFDKDRKQILGFLGNTGHQGNHIFGISIL